MRKSTLVVLLGLAFLLGTALRLYLVADQILVDDEWHGISWVIGKSYGDVLSEFNPKNNASPPLNLYRLFLLRTVGWSELWLRLPSLIAGILCVLALPLAARRLVGDRAAVLLAYLLAVSPFLVFYSRFSRAYSAVALLAFLALIALHRWIVDGKRGAAVGFVVAGSLASWLHLTAALGILAPLAFAIVARSVPTHRLPRIERSAPALLGVSGALGATLAVLLLPALLRAGELPWAHGRLTAGSLPETLQMLAGTAEPIVASLFAVLLLFGLVLLLHDRPLLGWLCTTTIVAYGAALAITRPPGAHHAIVILRYAMPVVPIGLLCVAVALDGWFVRMSAGRRGLDSRHGALVGAVAVGGFPVVLFAVGPLPASYAAPNNFTNHSAFQGSYERRSLERSDARHVLPSHEIDRSEVPRFYSELAADRDVDSIVEYPLDVTNFNNKLYYYQQIHGKRVLAGYTTEADIQGWALDRKGRFVVGGLIADRILSRVADPDKLRFTNMVDVGDPERLRRSGAGYLVLHRKIEAAILSPGYEDSVTCTFLSTRVLGSRYRKLLGEPVYEDPWVIVFRIPRA